MPKPYSAAPTVKTNATISASCAVADNAVHHFTHPSQHSSPPVRVHRSDERRSHRRPTRVSTDPREARPVTLILGLAALALVDSTSIGTLVVPLWLLLAPDRLPLRRMLVYLLAIAGFYFVVGVALLFGASAGLARFGDLADSPWVLWPQLALGIALFAVSWRFDSRKRRERGEADRTAAWRDRALKTQSSGRGLAVLAVSAGTLEVLSMVPYLAAIGLLVSTDLPGGVSVALLAGYCAVMVVPALVLIGVRNLAHRQVEPLLIRLNDWLSRHADSATGWALAIAGIVVARGALGGLFGGG
ncbi:GAP family protein [Nocardia cyriacigeorgica]|nr:GAP family protein [Nocardia cyriacigeorgica]